MEDSSVDRTAASERLKQHMEEDAEILDKLAEGESAAQTPKLVKVAARAMLNDPNSISGELVRAWKALVAENRELRRELATREPNQYVMNLRAER